jgi:leucyl-tRNA synthetase
VRSHVVVPSDADQTAVEAAALADEKVIANLDGGTPKKVIFIPGRMLNIVI